MKKVACLFIILSLTKNVISQNVGVGTATPAQKLDVNGNLKVSGAIMPGGVAGVAGQVLTSNGANTAPSWLTVANTVTSKTYVPILTNTASSGSRNIFSNSSAAVFQTDSVDFGSPRYNIGTDITINSTTGINNFITINTDGLYRVEGGITIHLQNTNTTLSPAGFIEMLIFDGLSNSINAFTAPELIPLTTVSGTPIYQATFKFNVDYFFSAGDKFTFKATIRNLASSPHVNIGIISPSYFSIYKISD